ncbi:MAG: hypothetical protein ACLUCZ_07320 [Thomasclavelia ramosa]
MFSKEECEIALENAVDTGIIKKDWNVLNQLIEEHFKPNKPYKFEDLKPNMWVWDDLIKECVQLDEDCFEPDNVILILMRGNYGYRESTRTFFEENRFFPVQRANPES